MFWELEDVELDALYKRYRGNIDLLKIERPDIYHMYEHHLTGKNLEDAINYFNSWLFNLIFHDREHRLE
jgi:hypothetical protein